MKAFILLLIASTLLISNSYGQTTVHAKAGDTIVVDGSGATVIPQKTVPPVQKSKTQLTPTRITPVRTEIQPIIVNVPSQPTIQQKNDQLSPAMIVLFALVGLLALASFILILLGRNGNQVAQQRPMEIHITANGGKSEVPTHVSYKSKVEIVEDHSSEKSHANRPQRQPDHVNHQ